MIKVFLICFLFFLCTFADQVYDKRCYNPGLSEKDQILAALNSTTGGPYTYSQSQHHFWGQAFDGTNIDTRGACCGQSGPCRDNPSCQCQPNVGPLPRGTYTIGNMQTFKGMPYCYPLIPQGDTCGRGGFLIHGGGCGGNPSEGCIVIEDQGLRYLIKSNSVLNVVG